MTNLKVTNCSGDPNLDFVPSVQEVCGPDDTILVMCATGGRGAMSVDALAKAGFSRVYNIVTGFEGDRVDDPGSVFHGKHMRKRLEERRIAPGVMTSIRTSCGWTVRRAERRVARSDT
jgi:hypothetical protein